MNAEKYVSNDLKNLLLKNKIATLDELKTVMKTKSTMTVFRKLKQFEYISSYSHRGKYYSLNEIAQYDPYGIWSHRSVGCIPDSWQKQSFFENMSELLPS